MKEELKKWFIKQTHSLEAQALGTKMKTCRFLLPDMQILANTQNHSVFSRRLETLSSDKR